MIKRDIKETVYYYDENGNLCSKEEREIHEEENEADNSQNIATPWFDTIPYNEKPINFDRTQVTCKSTAGEGIK